MPSPSENRVSHELRQRALPLAKDLLRLAQAEWERGPEWRKLDRYSYWPYIENLPGGGKIMDDIAASVLKLNPRMVSQTSVRDAVSRAIAGRVAWNPHVEPTDADLVFEQEVIAGLSALAALERHRDVDVPVLHLVVERRTQVGPVVLHPVSQGDPFLDSPFLRGDEKPFICALARVRSPGDDETARQFCLASVRQALSLVRGFAAPYLAQRPFKADFDVMGCVARPVRTAYGFEGDHAPRTLSGVTAISSHLWKEVFAFIGEPSTLRLLSLAKGGFAQKGIAGRILWAFRWLGEAVKPDPAETRFAKAALALEAALGGDSEKLSTRGITAMLAERAAFLLGSDLESRVEIDERVRALYSKRSKLFHGDPKAAVTEADVEDLTLLAWSSAVALLDRLPELRSVKSLDAWAQTQRYR